MKVFYQRGSNWKLSPVRLPEESNMLSLSFNNWDDYGVGTTFNAILFIDKEVALEFSLKILIENDKFSPSKLNQLRDSGWDGFFPIPGLDYVSVPSNIDFYNVLIAKIGIHAAKEVLVLIRDAGYLRNHLKDERAIRLAEHADFENSLLREAGARKAYVDGWMLFDERESSINDFALNIISKNGGVEAIKFRFNSKNLPYDINVLIGPNGSGKSFTLKTLVENWLGVDSGRKDGFENRSHIPFDRYPNISKLILISYSPFEEFALDLSGAGLKNEDAYKYFGFRQRRETDGGEVSIGISRNLPARNSVESIITAISDDKRLGFIAGWSNKLETIVSVLKPAIGFDFMALSLLKEHSNFNLPYGNSVNIKEDKYIVLDELLAYNFESQKPILEQVIDYSAGVVFIKEKDKVELSSGQRLFCYIVINVVGQIRKDSLVIIDEPELFLHPALEIEFISLLKKVLSSFNSKAILATHSLAVTREVPANCVHVFKPRDGGIDIDNPPFETFGGDMQRISSYVFGDNSISKPFDSWIEEKIRESSSVDDLIAALGTEINEEIRFKILNSGKRNG